MKNRILKVLIFFALIVATVIYTYYFNPLTDDELYNYGFSYNIVTGLIPYKDFNMIIPPLFSYLLAFFLKIFGSKLLVYHVIIATLITTICFISYKELGKKTIIIYLLLLIYPYIGYNTFALTLLFILLYIEDKKKTSAIYLEPIIISLMFLTKQTLGSLVIPSLIFSKNKKKTMSIYLIFSFLFLLYLIINGTTVEFFDYCLFGMFDFTTQNATSFNILLIIEMLIIIGLVIAEYKTKRKDIFFCLMFQIIAFPIVNYIHFIISFVPIIYIIYKKYKTNSYLAYLGIITTLSFFLTTIFIFFAIDKKHLVTDNYRVNNFMKDRATSIYTEDFFYNLESILSNYNDYTIYTFGKLSYLIKLNCNIPITKYDIINNGNMGYNGSARYLAEIDNHCNKNKCLFIVESEENNIYPENQSNEDIIMYARSNHLKIYASDTIDIYIN